MVGVSVDDVVGVGVVVVGVVGFTVVVVLLVVVGVVGGVVLVVVVSGVVEVVVEDVVSVVVAGVVLVDVVGTVVFLSSGGACVVGSSPRVVPSCVMLVSILVASPSTGVAGTAFTVSSATNATSSAPLTYFGEIIFSAYLPFSLAGYTVQTDFRELRLNVTAAAAPGGFLP